MKKLLTVFIISLISQLFTYSSFAGSDGTLEYAKKNNIKFTFSEKNIGLCSSINKVSKISKYDYLLYSIQI